MISRDEFVNNLLEKTEQIDNQDLLDFFSNLNWEKEIIFSNIYDLTFSKPLTEIKEQTLNWLLIAFIGSEKDWLENRWISEQIQEIIPDTTRLFKNMEKLIIKPNIEDSKIEFEENYADKEPLKTMRNSQVTLFELLTTENWQKEFAKKYLISNIEWKLKNFSNELFFIKNFLNTIEISGYNIEENKIHVNITNNTDMFILWTIRNHIKPLEIINDSNVEINNVEKIWADFNDFIKNYFSRCLHESWMTNILNHCKVIEISLNPRRIELGISNKNMCEKIDEQLSNSKVRQFFPNFNIFYRIENVDIKDNTENTFIATQPKSLNTNCPVSKKIDETKTIDNFYSLEEHQVQSIIELIKEWKNIAIYWPIGSWKTHFAQALKNIFKSEKNVVYTTWEKFCSVFWDLARNYKWENIQNKDKNKNNFLDTFGGINILIIDWIDALWWETRWSTQNILKQILTKNPEMRLIITSKKIFNEIPRTKKHKTADGAVWYESSSLLEEIPNLNLAILQSSEKDRSKKIIENQRKLFLEKKNDLFLPRELPVGVVNFLSRKINPSIYGQIFESIKLNLGKDFSCDNIFKIIQNLVSEKIRPEPEEIIEIIVDSFANNWDMISKYINLETDITLRSKKDIEERLNSDRKNNHLKNILVSFCVFFIKQSFPKKTFSEIWIYFGNRKDCSKLYNDAFEILSNRKSLNSIFEWNIKDFLLKTYGVDWQQISIF